MLYFNALEDLYKMHQKESGDDIQEKEIEYPGDIEGYNESQYIKEMKINHDLILIILFMKFQMKI